MTVAFIDAKHDQCMTPVEGDPGPQMQVCGAPVIPGRTCCPDCRSKLYERPTSKAAAEIEVTAKRSQRQQRMTTGPVLTGW